MRQVDEHVAGHRHIGLADDRLAGLQGGAAARAVDAGAQEIPEILRGGQDDAVLADDAHGVEAVGLLLHARDFRRKNVWRIDLRRQVAGAVRQLLLRRLQEVARAFGQFGRVDAVRFQRIDDELVALHAIAGVEGVGRGGKGAEYGEGKD
ncbi:hypothetical protein G6F24_014895 [Rhizopus arrhizus]|nr:hypothetical protein G6F24_014895 [Rhizopus arrhizus]